MANSFHTHGYKINLFVLAQTCYSKHLVYEERQRREHAIKLQSFPEYDVPLWSFTNVYEMTMFILLFDYIFKVKSVSLKFCHDMFANFLNGIPLLDHLPLSTILIKRQENRRSSTFFCSSFFLILIPKSKIICEPHLSKYNLYKLSGGLVLEESHFCGGKIDK